MISNRILAIVGFMTGSSYLGKKGWALNKIKQINGRVTRATPSTQIEIRAGHAKINLLVFSLFIFENKAIGLITDPG